MLAFENLDAYLVHSGFSKVCVLPGGVSVQVLFDVEDSEIADGSFISADARLTGKAEDLKSLKQDDVVTIDTNQFLVQRPPKRIEDGLLMIIYLQEVLN